MEPRPYFLRLALAFLVGEVLAVFFAGDLAFFFTDALATAVFLPLVADFFADFFTDAFLLPFFVMALVTRSFAADANFWTGSDSAIT